MLLQDYPRLLLKYARLLSLPLGEMTLKLQRLCLGRFLYNL